MQIWMEKQQIVRMDSLMQILKLGSIVIHSYKDE